MGFCYTVLKSSLITHFLLRKVLRENVFYSMKTLSTKSLFLICSFSFQSVIAYENPRYHYDVKIILISRVFGSIEIDGYHNSNDMKEQVRASAVKVLG